MFERVGKIYRRRLEIQNCHQDLSSATGLVDVVVIAVPPTLDRFGTGSQNNWSGRRVSIPHEVLVAWWCAALNSIVDSFVI